MEDGARDLRSIPYQRPNQAWVCGHQRDGQPCRIGPDQRGRCLATSECRPVRKGDRWECTRPAHAGGSCAHGPRADGACALPIAPCAPVRSFGSKRALALRWTALAAIAALAIGLSARWRYAVLSPGGLSSAHALLAAQGEQGCAACHGLPAAAAGLAAAAPTPPGDTGRCLACHGAVAGGASWGQPHSIAAAALAPVTARRQGSRAAPRGLTARLASFAPLGVPAGAIQCVACHREHRGAAHRLTALSDAACETCHTAPFGSLEQHPEFGSLGPAPNVAFDHAAHQSTHFGSAPFRCQACHAPEPGGRQMSTRGFEQTCSGCHEQGSADHHGDAIRRTRLQALQLPEMTLDPAPWPADAAVGERLPPVLRLLLAGEPAGPGFDAVRALYRDEDAEGVPLDWLGTPDQKAALAHAIDGVVRELATGDVRALRDRLALALAAPPDDPALAMLIEQIATGALAAGEFQRRFMPDPAAAPPSAPSAAPGRMAAGWTIDPADSTLSYRPATHGDRLLRSLADALAEHADGTRADRDAEDPDAVRRDLRTRVFNELTSRQTGGVLYASCLKCHQAESSGGAFRIPWQVEPSNGPLSRLTTFDHATHAAAPAGADACSRCHVVSAAPVDAQEASRPAAAGPAMGIDPVRKAQCTVCHAPGRARSGCVTCHRYHAASP